MEGGISWRLNRITRHMLAVLKYANGMRPTIEMAKRILIVFQLQLLYGHHMSKPYNFNESIPVHVLTLLLIAMVNMLTWKLHYARMMQCLSRIYDGAIAF